MRDLNELNAWRVHSREVIERFGSAGDGTCGVFLLAVPHNSRDWLCVASSGEGWDHVSVSSASRMPDWNTMDWIKRRFFRPDEVAVQFHVTPVEHINIHPYCLHLWRPHGIVLPLPPGWMV